MAEASVLSCGPLVTGLERDLGLSPEAIARALDVDRRTVERWRANQTVPHGTTRERLAELLDLRDRLLQMFGTPSVAQEWLRAGRLDRVRADLDGLAAGVFL